MIILINLKMVFHAVWTTRCQLKLQPGLSSFTLFEPLSPELCLNREHSFGFRMGWSWWPEREAMHGMHAACPPNSRPSDIFLPANVDGEGNGQKSFNREELTVTKFAMIGNLSTWKNWRWQSSDTKRRLSRLLLYENTSSQIVLF